MDQVGFRFGTKDSLGFYYSRFRKPRRRRVSKPEQNQKVYYHTVGTSQADDILVLEDPENPDWGFGPGVTDDGKFLVVTVWVGTADKYRVKYRRLDQKMPSGLI